MSGIVGSYFNTRGSGVVAKLGTDGQVFTSTGAGLSQGFEAAAAGGALVQLVNFQTGTLATGTTLVPHDDTVPQNDEGTEFMTLAITPTSDTNKLLINVILNMAGSAWANNPYLVSLFQDDTANALACQWHKHGQGNTMAETWNFNHYMTSGTASETTFKVRCGAQFATTVSFNGEGGLRYTGGITVSSMTIMEIAV